MSAHLEPVGERPKSRESVVTSHFVVNVKRVGSLVVSPYLTKWSERCKRYREVGRKLLTRGGCLVIIYALTFLDFRVVQVLQTPRLRGQR